MTGESEIMIGWRNTWTANEQKVIGWRDARTAYEQKGDWLAGAWTVALQLSQPMGALSIKFC